MPLRGEETQERLLAMFVDALGAVGAYMTDDAITDIMANADGRVWVQGHTGGQVESGLRIKPAQVEQIIRLVANRHCQVVGDNIVTRQQQVLSGRDCHQPAL
jgi:Flp pilus assembly CpaF family ATPase